MGILLLHDIIEHENRVALLGRKFMQYLSAPEKEAAVIFSAALNHDIGKVSVGEDILLKPGKLSNKEFGTVKNHPKIGATIMAQRGLNAQAVKAILQHHESWDGSGYPYGDTRHNISYPARILKLCDVYDALTHKRCYRSRVYLPEEAIEQMDIMATQFEPELYIKFREFIKVTYIKAGGKDAAQSIEAI